VRSTDTDGPARAGGGRLALAVAVALGAAAIGAGLVALGLIRGCGDRRGPARSPAASDAGVAASTADAEAALAAGAAEVAAGRLADAEPHLRRAIALFAAARGPQHLDTARGWHALGDVLAAQGTWAEARTALATAVTIREQRGGDGVGLATSLLVLATAEQGTGHHQDAVVSIETAVDLLREAGPAHRHQLALALAAEGRALASLGHPDDARERLDDALALFAAIDDQDLLRGLTLVDRGGLARDRGDCAAAIPDFEAAAAFFSRVAGAADPYNVYALVPLGRCLVELGQAAQALPVLDRALALPARGGMEDVYAVQARFDRGRALVLARRDRAGGLAAARAARAEMDTVPGAASLAPAADAWLAGQR
jgi:tetratricopeptide (TPR) repeat protein